MPDSTGAVGITEEKIRFLLEILIQLETKKTGEKQIKFGKVHNKKSACPRVAYERTPTIQGRIRRKQQTDNERIGGTGRWLAARECLLTLTLQGTPVRFPAPTW